MRRQAWLGRDRSLVGVAVVRVPRVAKRGGVPEAIAGAMEERFEVEEIGDSRLGVPEDGEGAGDDEVDVAGGHREICNEIEDARSKRGDADVDLATIECVAVTGDVAEGFE